MRLESAIGSAFYALLNLLLLSILTLILQYKGRGKSLGRATNLAMLALIALRLAAAVIYARVWLRGEDLVLFPAIERSVLLLSLAVLAWLWLRNIPGEVATRLLAAALGLCALGVSALFWMSPAAGQAFNYSPIDYAWGGLCAFILVSGLIYLWRRRAPGWRAGGIQLGILLLGVISHMLLAEPGADMPLAVQLAALFALPALAWLPMQAPVDTAAAPSSLDQAAPGEVPHHPMMEPYIEPEPESMNDWAVICQELCLAMGADLSFIGFPDPANKKMRIECGYNASSGGTLPSFSLALAKIPSVASALERGRSLRLAGGKRHSDLSALADALGLPQDGYLLAAPIIKGGSAMKKAVLLFRLSRAWLRDDEKMLESILRGESPRSDAPGPWKKEKDSWEKEFSWLPNQSGEPAESAAAVQPAGGQDGDVQGLLGRLAELEEENEQYRQEVQRLLAQTDLSIPPVGGAISEENPADEAALIEQIRQENEQLRDALSALEQSNAFEQSAASPENAPETPSPEIPKQEQEELRLALQEIARLQALLNQAKGATDNSPSPGEVGGSTPVPSEKAQEIASIAQDVRQPLSSVLGYTDLLLGESVGILGALQRSFLERVRLSTQRVDQMLADLIQLAAMDLAAFETMGQTVDPIMVINDALDMVQERIQKKELQLQKDFASPLPELPVDPDALQQIVFYLLKNACEATPNGRQIAVQASESAEEGLGDFVLIQVSDSGGGINQDDVPRVFSRVYRSTNPLIQGVGDTGVGLSIAETLTTALGGRIWVDSEPGVGATFSILLPTHPGAPPVV